jgi:hypothetical protein
VCVESFLTTLEGWADEVISSAVKYKIWRISRESLKIPYSTQITKTHLNSGHNPEVRTLLFLPTSGAPRVFKSVQTTGHNRIDHYVFIRISCRMLSQQ